MFPVLVICANLVAFSCLDDAFGIAALLQREPAALLRVVRLCKILPQCPSLTQHQKNYLLLLFVGDEEVLGGVRVRLPCPSPLHMARHLSPEF